MITIDLVWYWLALGLLAIPSGILMLVKAETGRTRIGILAVLTIVFGTASVALGVTRSIGFSIVFGGVFGLILSMTLWAGVRAGRKEALRPK